MNASYPYSHLELIESVLYIVFFKVSFPPLVVFEDLFGCRIFIYLHSFHFERSVKVLILLN